tara:strand:+ start:457 stop:780 length:324 start_codon:yes stop_codon:yes gene_type:complete
MKDLKVFISGPITDMPKANKEAFANMEQRLKDLGAEVFNPRRHQVPSGLIECEIWPTMMKLALQDFVFCDSIVMLNGWEDSRGASLEHTIASELCMKIYDENFNLIG